MTTDLANVIVSKPWGWEYLIYETEDMALWLLHIEQWKSTSLHCHPKKTTGFLLLSGEALVEFIADSKVITAPAKEMFRRGLFHKTTAISEGGVFVLEAENPNDKKDLVRLKDDHGRSSKGYESGENMSMKTGEEIQIPSSLDEAIYIEENEFSFAVEPVESLEFFQSVGEADIILFLSGGFGKIVDGRRHSATVPGDIGLGGIVSQVADQMEFLEPGTKILRVKVGSNP